MALAQDDTTTPFQWGSNGARLTPEQIAAQRKVADALAAQAGDASPFPAGTRGWGLATQGLARLAKGVSAGLDYREADQAAKVNADESKQLQERMFGTSPGVAAVSSALSAGPASSVVPNDANAIPGTVGMNQRLADRTQDFIQDNPGTSISSGVRSTSDQARLYANRDNNPNPVAVPGTSRHERGEAVDIAGMSPSTRAQLPQYGLAQPVANDAPHVELAAEPAATAGVAKVSGVLNGINPAVVQAATSPYADEPTKKIAGILLAAQLGKEKKDTFSQGTDADGNQYDINNTTHERKMFKAAEKDPTSVQEYNFYLQHPTPGQAPMDYATWSTARARAGATNVSTNVDMNSGQTYDKQLAEGLAKSHAGLANGVEDAQARARDLAAMQSAVDAIQKNGGTTGGMGQQQALDLKKTINAGANALGIEQPFNENDLSDKEFLTKFNRSIAGAQAKGAVGSRVTNFELSNYLKANPGLDMSITGNQRLLGIQSQIEQRNIAVGNAIREATAAAISKGQKIDPVTVQGIITDYDRAHHVQDPITGQDLTQSYALPEFQQGGNNPALAVGHETNLNGIRIKRVN